MKDLSSFKRCEHLEENFNLEKYFDLEGFGKALLDNIDIVLECEFLEVQKAKEEMKNEFAKLEKAYLIHDLEKIQNAINEYIETIKYYQDNINYVYEMDNIEVANWFIDMHGYESLGNINIDSYIDYKAMFYDNIKEVKTEYTEKKIKVYTVTEFYRYTYSELDIDSRTHIVTRDKMKALKVLENVKKNYCSEAETYKDDKEESYMYYHENGDGATISLLINEV